MKVSKNISVVYKIFITCFSVVNYFFISAQVNSNTVRKPNIILILTDDAGYADFGFQTNKLIPTPNIDALANEGMIFTQAYVTAPNCSPSRAGLLTGKYQESFGHEYNLVAPKPIGNISIDSMGLPLSQKLMSQYLKDEGYSTAIIGKWHLGEKEYYHPNYRGFDYFFGMLEGGSPYFTGKAKAIQRNGEYIPADSLPYLTDAFGNEAVSYINSSSSKPFFLFLSFNAPHTPMQAKEEYLIEYSAKFKTNERAINAGMTRSIDDNVGKVIDALKQNNLLDNTLIVFTNDNGGQVQASAANNFPLRGMKTMFYEGGIRVPMFFYWKGKIKAGRSDMLASTLDFLPTFLSADEDNSKLLMSMEGKNLIPFLLNGKKVNTTPLFWRQGKIGAVRNGDWKLIVFEDKARESQLYNLKNDIGERNDLFEKNKQKTKNLLKLYRAWENKMAKPLWTGGPSDEQVIKLYDGDLIIKN